MTARLIAAGLSIAAMAWAGSGEATPVPAPVSSPAAAQFYVLSFTDAPIAEVAEAVVGGALSRDLAIDPAVEGTMSFTVEGAFTPEALLQEFGTAALDQGARDAIDHVRPGREREQQRGEREPGDFGQGQHVRVLGIPG